MDVIVQSIAGILAFVFGVVGNIFAHDICASADNVCSKIIKAAAARLAAFDREPTEQEWLSDLHDHQTVVEKYRHAIGCYLAAPEMRRYALEEGFGAQAPGLVWRKWRDIRSEARWQSSSEAIEAGYGVKSVRLWVGDRNSLTAEEKEFIIDVTLQLQAEHDQWLYEDAYRDRCLAESEQSELEIQKLMQEGYTRIEAAMELFCIKDDIPEEPPKQ